MVGGRITRPLADYFFTHMQVIRSGVTLVAPYANGWPHYVLNMEPGDVLVVFDIRRYEREIAAAGGNGERQGVEIVLFTDQWGSPVGKYASHSFRARIEAPSAWDSSVVILFIVEALIAAVESANWPQTRDRMKTLEALFDKTRMFRKFT